MNRKTFILGIILILFCSMLWATDYKTYKVEKLNYTISVPYDFTVYNYYRQNSGSYFTANARDRVFTMTVSSQNQKGIEYNKLTDTALREIAENQIALLRQYGATGRFLGVKTINGNKYSVVKINVGEYIQIQYQTAKDNRISEFGFTMKTLTSEEQSLIEEIMGSVRL